MNNGSAGTFSRFPPGYQTSVSERVCPQGANVQYNCQSCVATFTRKAQLVAHAAQIHPVSDELTSSSLSFISRFVSRRNAPCQDCANVSGEPSRKRKGTSTGPTACVAFASNPLLQVGSLCAQTSCAIWCLTIMTRSLRTSRRTPV